MQVVASGSADQPDEKQQNQCTDGRCNDVSSGRRSIEPKALRQNPGYACSENAK